MQCLVKVTKYVNIRITPKDPNFTRAISKRVRKTKLPLNNINFVIVNHWFKKSKENNYMNPT